MDGRTNELSENRIPYRAVPEAGAKKERGYFEISKFEIKKISSMSNLFLKKIKVISQTDQYLVCLSSKTYVFEDKMTKYWSV